MNPTERVEIIRSWRDRTAHIFSVPYAHDDPGLVRSTKGWWRDVDALLTDLGGQIDDLLDLVVDLLDDGECRYDHHGYCQEHPIHEPPCPHGRARELLAQLGATASPSALCFCGEDHLTGWCLRDVDAELPAGFPLVGETGPEPYRPSGPVAVAGVMSRDAGQPVGWVLADDLPPVPWQTVFVDADMDGAIPLYRHDGRASLSRPDGTPESPQSGSDVETAD